MRKYFIAAIVSLFVGLTLLAPTSPARAATTDLAWSSCPNLKSWSPNEDEQDRRPTPTVDGLQFEGNQLVHHPVAMDLKDVHPGAYAATPAPSLVDFFSIEVYSPDAPHGYGTLRWNTTGANAGQWNIGGTNFYGTDAVQLATDHARSTNVVSFGVGYVATPATGTKTVVSSVTFHGVVYPLTCKPATGSTGTPKPTKTTDHRDCAAYLYAGSKVSLCDRFPAGSNVTCTQVGYRVTPVSKSNDPWGLDGNTGTAGIGCESQALRHFPSVTPNPPKNGPSAAAGGALAITGPNGKLLGAGAVVLVTLGGALLVISRRRRTHFRA